MKKFICFLIGHDDPVMDGIGFEPQEKLYELWKTITRKCRRCDKELKP